MNEQLASTMEQILAALQSIDRRLAPLEADVTERRAEIEALRVARREELSRLVADGRQAKIDRAEADRAHEAQRKFEATPWHQRPIAGGDQ